MGDETLILLHGFTQTRRSWDPVRAQLAGARYRPVAPDLPGHGSAAGRRPVSFAACVGYVRALADGPFALCGYSMGGRIALHVALALGPRLVTRLVLLGASPGLADERERADRRAGDEALARRIEQDGVEPFARAWGALPLFAGQTPEVAARAHADRLRNTPAGLAAALRGLGTGVMEPLWDRLGELAGLPVTYAAGEHDAEYRALAARMAERTPGAGVHVVPHAGHAAHLEQPAAFAGLLAG